MRNMRCFRSSSWAGAWLLVGAFGIAAAACGPNNSSGTGGSGTGATGAGTGATTGAGGVTPADGCYDYTSFDGTSPTVQFKADVLPIFRQSCGLSASCHQAENPPLPAEHFLGPSVSMPAPTAMQIEEILSGIVGVKSVDEPDMDVVAPGDPAHSFMMYKLDGDPSNLDGLTCSKLKCAAGMTCLLSMPSGGPQLPTDERDRIRRWIAQGAKND